MKFARLLLPVVAALIATSALAEPPHIERRGDAQQLIVDGQPFLILGGELDNSSAANRDYLKPQWAWFEAMHMNTVLAPVSWELIEPQEGKFDFSTVDWLLEDARAHHMHLVLLWFGTWKNSMSSYVPAWVKRDTKRFARTLDDKGQPQEIISAYSANARNADATAFAALMRHLKQADGAQHTVLMVQVENEVGFLPLAKEGKQGADPAADEREQAAAYARYVEAIAKAGKAEYPLPMYVNGAQNRPGVKPGAYPSGGPLIHVAKEWRGGAPSLDMLSPDVYFPDFAEIADRYAATGTPMFVPEAERADDPHAGANALHLFGHDAGIGFSPFAIDSVGEDASARIGSLYEMLGEIAPLVLSAQAERRIAGFSNPVSYSGEVDTSPMTASFGGVIFTATTTDPWTSPDKQQPAEHGALLIWLGGEDYLVAGQGVTFTMAPQDGKGKVGLETVEAGHFADGKWATTQRLNGDQTHQGRHVRLPPGDYTMQKVRLYRY